MQCAGRHLQFDVVAVVLYAADSCQVARTQERLAVLLARRRFRNLQILHCDLTAQALGSQHDGIHDLLVACASADVSVLGEPVTHFFSCRIRVLFQQLIGRNDEARDTETALHRAVMHERDLDRMQEVRLSDSLDGRHFAVLFDL